MATKALAIARAIDEPSLVAGALYALCVVVWDPERHEQHSKWTDELLALARSRPTSRGIDGHFRSSHVSEPSTATSRAHATRSIGSPVRRHGVVTVGGLFDASYADVLRASVAGEWSAARACRAPFAGPQTRR